ncbi:MAG: isochorismatase family protein [Rubrivivax sp.]|nr:isochorismatase family protein [Rubrivivax sp.]
MEAAEAMQAGAAVLVLVDYQARLMPAIHDAQAVVAHGVLLAQAAHALGIPVIGTEQNPAALGPNVESIRSECPVTLAKTHFDACADGLLDTLRAAKPQGRREVVIAGCEAHVCMMQTALGLLRAGERVWVVASASGSRRPADHAAAMARLGRAGATIVTHEMVLFEWLGDCEHARFRQVLKIIKGAG